MSKAPKDDAMKDFLTFGLNQKPGDYLSGPFNLPPKPEASGTEVGGAPTIDTGHEYVIRTPKRHEGSEG